MPAVATADAVVRRGKTLRSSEEFRRVIREGTRRRGRLLVVDALETGGSTRAGFVCGRAVGGAVQRNRAKRLLREAWRATLPAVAAGFDVVVTALPAARAAGLEAVEIELRELLTSAGAAA